ncbi:unnamed protein product [Cuscuta europaea]|uniref:Uncharacterized protein n=1 Tax=Cuscuta europaea TaxID=41803 RepID=A0A9P1DX28_CUSEU|nr:unnamed protein product [Cuscuta europaea]
MKYSVLKCYIKIQCYLMGYTSLDPGTHILRRIRGTTVTQWGLNRPDGPPSARKISTQNMVQKPREPGVPVGHGSVGQTLVGHRKLPEPDFTLNYFYIFCTQPNSGPIVNGPPKPKTWESSPNFFYKYSPWE